MRRFTWCGLSGTTRSAAAGSSAVRSASTARAKGPASSRRSSRRPEALLFEARTRTSSCPARAVGVMSPQDEAGDLGPAQPGAERQRHDRGIAPAAARGRRRRLPPPAAALGPSGRPHQIERRRVGRARRPGGAPPRAWRRADARYRAACPRPAASSSGPPARRRARRPRSPPPRPARSKASGSRRARRGRRPPAPGLVRAGSTACCSHQVRNRFHCDA